MRLRKRLFTVFFLIFFVGCAWTPVRKEVKVDLTLPVGKIEDNRFTGIRFPFRISVLPINWKITTEFPPFMEEMGFEVEGLEESEIFIYNPSTRSNLQIDFVPAGRYSRFDQKLMEWLVGSAAASSFEEEFEQDHGKVVNFELGPTTPYTLKGVQYAAKKYAIYTINGVKWEHGWIYGFSEPYQIFIIYILSEREGVNDRKDIEEILSSFEMLN